MESLVTIMAGTWQQLPDNCTRDIGLAYERCVRWGTWLRETCLEWGLGVVQQCQQWADEGYNACGHWSDQGQEECWTGRRDRLLCLYRLRLAAG